MPKHHFDWRSAPQRPKSTAIVTGANTGLGFETAKAFATKGITTVLACRTEARALEAKAKIEAAVPGAKLVFIPLDLTELASVRRFAAAFGAAFGSLDLLVLNAGIMTPPYAKTVDGFESQLAANFFGHFLLTALLLDRMPDAPSSRVVSLSSIAHRSGKQRIVFEDLHWERGYSAIGAWKRSHQVSLWHIRSFWRRIMTSQLHGINTY
jgi:NAD(P)-dependent dehydrogenase (short-subunit alcohol dehydrogenase family)